MKRDDALELARAANVLLVAKGKKVVDVNMAKESLNDDEIAKLIVGPTGNLRAPTLRIGKRLIVGFNESMYEGLFG